MTPPPGLPAYAKPAPERTALLPQSEQREPTWQSETLSLRTGKELSGSQDVSFLHGRNINILGTSHFVLSGRKHFLKSPYVLDLEKSPAELIDITNPAESTTMCVSSLSVATSPE